MKKIGISLTLLCCGIGMHMAGSESLAVESAASSSSSSQTNSDILSKAQALLKRSSSETVDVSFDVIKSISDEIKGCEVAKKEKKIEEIRYLELIKVRMQLTVLYAQKISALNAPSIQELFTAVSSLSSERSSYAKTTKELRAKLYTVPQELTQSMQLIKMWLLDLCPKLAELILSNPDSIDSLILEKAISGLSSVIEDSTETANSLWEKSEEVAKTIAREKTNIEASQGLLKVLNFETEQWNQESTLYFGKREAPSKAVSSGDGKVDKLLAAKQLKLDAMLRLLQECQEIDVQAQLASQPEPSFADTDDDDEEDQKGAMKEGIQARVKASYDTLRALIEQETQHTHLPDAVLSGLSIDDVQAHYDKLSATNAFCASQISRLMGETAKVRVRIIDNRGDYVAKLGLLKTHYLEEYNAREEKIRTFKERQARLRELSKGKGDGCRLQ